MKKAFTKQFPIPIWVKDKEEMEAIIAQAEQWWKEHKPENQSLRDWMDQEPRLTFKFKK